MLLFYSYFLHCKCAAISSSENNVSLNGPAFQIFWSGDILMCTISCMLSLSHTHNVYVYVSVSFSLLMQTHTHLSCLSSKKGNNNTLECLWGFLDSPAQLNNLTALNNSKNVFLCLFRDQFVRQTCAFGRSIVGQDRKISIYTYVYN